MVLFSCGNRGTQTDETTKKKKKNCRVVCKYEAWPIGDMRCESILLSRNILFFLVDKIYFSVGSKSVSLGIFETNTHTLWSTRVFRTTYKHWLCEKRWIFYFFLFSAICFRHIWAWVLHCSLSDWLTNYVQLCVIYNNTEEGTTTTTRGLEKRENFYLFFYFFFRKKKRRKKSKLKL